MVKNPQNYFNNQLTNFLITGIPGIGKTTLIKKLSEELSDLKPVGFYTSEIRERGVREGFEFVSFEGLRMLFSHKEIISPHKVGKYKVDVKGFEMFLDKIQFFSSRNILIIIDEIGKMECLSDKFRKIVKELLDSKKRVLATISLNHKGFIEEIKRRADIKLYRITLVNRDFLLSEILEDVRESLSGLRRHKHVSLSNSAW